MAAVGAAAEAAVIVDSLEVGVLLQANKLLVSASTESPETRRMRFMSSL